MSLENIIARDRNRMAFLRAKRARGRATQPEIDELLLMPVYSGDGAEGSPVAIFPNCRDIRRDDFERVCELRGWR